MKERFKNYFVNLFVPSFVLGSVTGIITAVVICFYKLCATYIIELSGKGYELLRATPIWLAAVLPVLFLVALCFAKIYRKNPDLSGGGIPTSVGALRGLLPVNGLKTLIGIFTMSITSFLIGVPLGNEGPSVQMGTAVGKCCVRSLAKKHWAWERYSMTGGACAGFSVATGAPISGVLFAVEEAHQRISPMLLTVSATSVMFAEMTAELLSSVLPIHTLIFPKMSLMSLTPRDCWLPIVIGVSVGVFAVLFLKYYHLIRHVIRRIKKKIPNVYLIFAVFAVTVILGLFSSSFISTGHDLMLSLFDGGAAIHILLIVLLVRATVTLFASSVSISGGLFVPILALGALFSSVIGQIMVSLFGVSSEYLTIILVLGITACISAMMKMPLTAIVFAVEALSCYGNVLYVVAVAVVSYIITEFFGVKSINDSVIEHRVENLHKGAEATVSEAFITVNPGSFAVGKQVRDIFWPSNLFILSIKYVTNDHVEVDERGGIAIRAGDVLHVRYSTYDSKETLRELFAIVGEQEIDEIRVDRA